MPVVLPGALVAAGALFAAASTAAEGVTSAAGAAPPAAPAACCEFVVEPDAYYADVELIVTLSRAPALELGERSELELYGALLTRGAVLPTKLVLEASVNPMPLAGVLVQSREPGWVDRAEVSRRFNLIKAVTAGFEEPYAVSVLAGNVARYEAAGAEGAGYSGYLVSAGNYHIKDNALVRDDWLELEWKLKGDRRSAVKKLAWSFRLGAKLHRNGDVADIAYVSLRRSRVDYRDEAFALLRNTGFEYTFDLGLRDARPMRHYALVDRFWPLAGTQVALSLAAGFVWESQQKYTGALADQKRRHNVQYLLRPNVEF